MSISANFLSDLPAELTATALSQTFQLDKKSLRLREGRKNKGNVPPNRKLPLGPYTTAW